jgi:hypothetical protein
MAALTGVIVFLSTFVLLVVGQEFPSEADNTNFWTTNYGAPVDDNDHSLTVGINGPTLLEDYTLIEKIANFDRYAIIILNFFTFYNIVVHFPTIAYAHL